MNHEFAIIPVSYTHLKAPDKSPARQWTMIHGIVGLAAGGIAILIQLLSGLSLQFALTLSLIHI